MNDNLSPAQVTQYYKEQTNQTNPLSPKEWLKSQTIDSSKLTPTTPIQLPPAQPDTTNYSAVTQAAASLAPATTTYQTPEQIASQDYKNAQTNQSQIIGNLTDLYGQITGREAYQAQQEADLGINQQQKNLQELTNQLNAIKTEGTLTPLKIQSEFAGRGATAGGVAPIESARNRENAIQALTVGAQIQAVQGNLTLAVQQAKRATDLKYGPLEKEIEMKERQLKLLNDYVLSPLEQERKAQQELALQQQKDALATKKASESDFNENMLIAQQAGMTNLEALEARRLFEAGRIDEANGIIAQYSSPKNQYQTVSEGQTLIDPRTGKIIYQAPKTYKPSTSGSSLYGTYSGGGAQYGSNLEAVIGRTENIIGSKFSLDAFRNNIARARNDADKINSIATVVLKGASADERKDFSQKAQALNSIDKAIAELDNGVKTGFMQNAAQYSFNMFGKDYDPKLAQIRSLLTSAIQPYRSSITGAAWGEQEDAEYQNLFGSTKYSPEELKNRLITLKGIMKESTASMLNAYVNPLNEGGNVFQQNTTPLKPGDTGTLSSGMGFTIVK